VATSTPRRYPVGVTQTILVVDDEPLALKATCRILQRAGFEVMTAENGRQAVELFQRERARIDLVLMDVIMPELQGPEACHELLQHDPDARVVLCSGFAGRSVLASCGARSFIPKPFEAAALLDVVTSSLED
jgi:CheY-like chemotaxis protein